MDAAVPVPEFEDLERTLENRRRQVEAALRRLTVRGRAPAVEAAVEDSLFAPAKRLRPILSLLVAEVLKGNPEAVLPAGCAIEMVHTASLTSSSAAHSLDMLHFKGQTASSAGGAGMYTAMAAHRLV